LDTQCKLLKAQDLEKGRERRRNCQPDNLFVDYVPNLLKEEMMKEGLVDYDPEILDWQGKM
jgi:hypothetical protein